MRGSRRCADDTRGHRLAAVEHFDVNPLRRHTQGCERLLHRGHEASRPAEVHIPVSWDADLIEDRPRQVPGSVEILSELVPRGRTALAELAAAVSERGNDAS